MRKFDFNTAAFIIAFVLAKGAEEAFRQALLLSDSGILIFVQRPIAAIFLVIGFGAMGFRIRSIMKQKGFTFSWRTGNN
jgi:putative tricarboxylic transport membrane protein